LAKRTKEEKEVDSQFHQSRENLANSGEHLLNIDNHSRSNLLQEVYTKLYTHPSVFEKMKEQYGGTNTGSIEEVKEEVVEEVKVVEKTTFDVELTSYDAGSKIKIIKEIKALLG